MKMRKSGKTIIAIFEDKNKWVNTDHRRPSRKPEISDGLEGTFGRYGDSPYSVALPELEFTTQDTRPHPYFC